MTAYTPVDFDMFQSWSPVVRMAYLAQPGWSRRCDCRAYGFPWPGSRVIRDNTTIHQEALCQPEREYIPYPEPA